MRPHAYMYGKKLDESREPIESSHYTKKMKEPPPQHEFAYRWFRGPIIDPCANENCIRRTSYSPHDWSKHALGGSLDCALQCVSTQSSLYMATFCNAKCFVEAWKSQYTVPKSSMLLSNGNRTATPQRSRSGSSNGSDDAFDEIASQRSNGSKSPNFLESGTPRGYLSGFIGGATNHQPAAAYSGTNGDYGDEWVEISRDHVYVPTDADVGHKLQIEASSYSLETGELLMSRIVKTDIVLGRAPQPVPRKVVTANNANKVASNGPRFRVVTYNVLAELYATQQQYPYTDFWALSWDYRFQNILREILDAAPDVVCLQEIQADHYESHVYAEFADVGFEGVYKQKTRQSMGLAGKVDGCALFWRRSKFHLVESYSIEFNEIAQRQATNVLGLNPRSEEGMQFINRLSKDNVAQLVVLEHIQQLTLGRTAQPREVNQICIANTHLYSNKDFPDVKLWQSWQLLQELESFVVSRGTNLPLIICGDFNSTPDTAVYDLLSRQTVHPGHPDVNVATNDDVPNVLPDAMNITHSFQLGSAYQTVLGDEPWVTNYTQNFKGVLDYIWYSAPNLRPLAVAPIPDEKELTRTGEALPSTEYSSDHIMLIADMQFISNSR
jgi:CCR4-NOT transcription complex subunit 6